MQKKPTIPPLSWLRAYESAARLSSLTDAANELFVSQSAISQHIRQLELHFGERLFIRKPRGVELTDKGKSYLPTVQDVFQRLESGTQDIFDGNSQSELTIKAGVTFIHQCLLPNISQFRKLYPNVKLRLLATVWPDSIQPDEKNFDLEIKHAPISVKDHSDSLVEESWYAMASPDLIEKLGDPDPVDLLKWPLIHSISLQSNWATWFNLADVDVTEIRISIEFDVIYFALAAATAGLGAVICSDLIARAELANGKIKILKGPCISYSSNHHIYVPQHSRNRPVVKNFVDWLYCLVGNSKANIKADHYY